MAASQKTDALIKTIKNMYDAESVAGKARYGINPHNNYGVTVETLRGIAEETGKDHDLALKLWASEIHDARILACLIDDPKMSTNEQIDEWAYDFDSWDVCDACCTHLFQNLPYAYEKAIEWSKNEVDFVKRAGFSLMARLAVSDKKAPDEKLEQFLPIIIKEASDNRNYVKKAVNWALRQIGKRNLRLNTLALQTAAQIRNQGTKSAKWIAADAIRELAGEKIQRRFKK